MDEGTKTKPDLVNILTLCPTIQLDIRYATSNNFLGFPVYSQPACFLHRDAALALQEVEQELATIGLGLKIFDGYRPLSVQQLMWDIVQDERYVSNPAKNKGRHTRGTAVDVTLVDPFGAELEMPTPFDDFTERAFSDSTDCSVEAQTHRALLKAVMERHQFEQFPYEWWHFDLQGWQDDVKYPPLDLRFEDI
jgi:D-alanyl-D-alanine dipeptidase